MNKSFPFRKPDPMFTAARFRRLKTAGRAILITLTVVGLFYSPALRAQTTAQLSGTVEDSSGGVIPSAQVTLINQATHDTRVAETNSVGFYSFPALLPSSYTVKVVAKGFQPKQLTDI
ncbi:MAG: carboxypeptidase-like regulatory domain-containing protein, partial [Acidobacteriaceae bacterium]